ncbi:hypothetical protein EVAR_92153_1 [Eumeta japonica]|uniref:Uncharacterized protein n=1 Tax=Eumeta variegata TaxID=151549 RepID=A0A4C1SZH8_EUMVA|nr:hypothetical protein EVAR_92153_1 [Eumeta japonica]
MTVYAAAALAFGIQSDRRGKPYVKLCFPNAVSTFEEYQIPVDVFTFFFCRFVKETDVGFCAVVGRRKRFSDFVSSDLYHIVYSFVILVRKRLDVRLPDIERTSKGSCSPFTKKRRASNISSGLRR